MYVPSIFHKDEMADNISRTTIRSFLFYRNPYLSTVLILTLSSSGTRNGQWLFRWYFRQAVLANMRGTGEPVLEHDFPPGSDMIGQILRGPKAAEVMEFHLFSRLATETDV